MTSSDIIAITAISVSGIVSIITLLANFLINRANIKAKRSEMAFEKRLGSFRSVYDTMSSVKRHIDFLASFPKEGLRRYSKYRAILNNEYTDIKEKATAELISRFMNIDNDFINVYDKNRVYFPPHIDKEIQNYYNEVLLAVRSHTLEKLHERIAEMQELQNKYSQRILKLMHEFIGLN